MCAIFGTINFHINQNDVREALSKMNHRGPDNNGAFFDQTSNTSVIFGHNRLEILDIKTGIQPMISKDGNFIVIYNGEIYNFVELRKKLISLGYKFETNHSDTEVLIHGFKEWGKKLPDYLDGMWSFAIYNKFKKEIFFSRDRFGEKPFFYYFKDKKFVFASELSAITHFKKLDLSLNFLNLKKYCAYGYFPNNLTPFKHIYKLEAGYNLTLNVSNMELIKNKYWSYKIEPDYKTSESEWSEQIYYLLDNSVKKRLVADVPVGVFLSGGLDSSIMAFFSQKNLNHKINTFSINFEEDTFDESKFSQYFSQKINSEHHNKMISSIKIKDILNEFLSKIDEPISDSSLLSYYLLCKFSRKKIKVALGGDAGDELFAGYDTFKAIKYANIITSLKLSKINPLLDSIISKIPSKYSYMNYKFKLTRFLRFNKNNLNTINCKWLSPLDAKEISKIFDDKTTDEDLYSDAIELWENNKNSNIVDKSLEFYTNFFLQNQILVKTDRLSMMNSLEVRSPFLDKDLIDCTRKIPNKLKLNGNISKYILKRTFEKKFGKKFTYRKKIGFSAPLSNWLINKNIDFNLKSDFLSKKKQTINEKFNEHCSFKKENRIYLWNIINLDNFLSKNGY